MENEKIKILVIDDLQDNLTTLRAIIKETFPLAKVYTALNGKEGIDLAISEDPDVILLDIVMPDINGFEVCRNLKGKDKLKDIPVVFITALKGDRESRIRALQAGAEAFLAKPVDEIELTAQIRAMAKIKRANIEKRKEKERLTILVKESTAKLEKELEERKKAEKELRESELCFRTLADSGQTLIWTSGKDKKCDYFNKSWLEFTGRTLEEELGDGWTENVHPDDLEQCVHIYSSAFDHREKFNVEYRLQRFDGQYRWVIDYGSPRFNTKGEFIGYIGHCIDITNQKENEILLRESEEIMRYIVKNDPNAIAVFDTNLNYIVTSDRYLQDYNINAESIIGKHHYEVFPEIPQRWRDIHKRCLEGAIEKNDDDSFIRQDGSTTYNRWEVRPWYKPDGRIGGIITYTEVTTERKLAEKEILKLSTGMEQSPASVIITDTTGIIEYSNTKFTEVSGYSKAELKGKMLRILKPGHTNDAVFNKIWSNLNSGKAWRGEHKNRKKSQEEYWESVLIAPIKDNNEDIINFIIISEDITPRKEMEAELLRAKEKAEENDRLKTAFLNNISHEIRTPLNAIVGFTGFLTEPGLSVEKIAYFTNIIQESSSQLLAIITDILNISSIEAGNVKSYEKRSNINHIFEKLFDQYIEKFREKNVNFRCSPAFSNEEAEVFTDETKLTQIISNLVSNALKFTNTGSVEIGYILQGDMLHFFCKDTGIGIARKDQDLIFERFRQVDYSDRRNYGGSGLGLAIARSYTEILEGQMWLDSEPGEGSVFYFTIPFKPVKPYVKDEVEKEKTMGRKLLIVEDEETNALLLEEYLSGQDINLLFAKDGAEALDIFKKIPEINLILMDIKMPVMDGFESINHIKALNPGVSVIAQTALALTGDREKILAHGFDDYIPKPIKKESIISLINKYF